MGNLPKDVSTWQFNFKFDLENDNSTPEAINLLETAGINFRKFFQKGICPMNFAESLISSGIVLNENVNWITFHGIYDLAYLLKVLTNQKMPDNEASFMEELEIYFHNHYDIRFVIRELNWLRGSLSRLATYLDIPRLGAAHQAGSDSLVTARLYFRIIDQFSEHLDLARDKNSVYGIYDEYNFEHSGNFNNRGFDFENQTINNLKANLNGN
jgi:CCR4-NOT transcription complex subunit 7/8